MGGTPYVRQNDTVLFQGANDVWVYTPATKTTSSFAGNLGPTMYGKGILADAGGNIIVLRRNLVYDSNATKLGTFAWGVDYMVITDGAVFSIDTGRTLLLQQCFDGSMVSLVTHVTDGYGLAVGPDGSFYYGQGNTNPAGVFKVAPGGGAPQQLTTVPMSVFAVAIDPSGSNVYVSGGGDHNTLWKINTATGAKVVYGCDPASTHKCGDTM
jgi:hypothetical protein